MKKSTENGERLKLDTDGRKLAEEHERRLEHHSNQWFRFSFYARLAAVVVESFGHARGLFCTSCKMTWNKHWTLMVLQQACTFFTLVQLFFVFFSIPIIILALLSPSLPVVTQIRGRIAGPSSPFSPRSVPSFFIAIKTQHFLPSSTRVELCVPTLLGALSS